MDAANEGTVRRYIENQQWDDPGENFKITTHGAVSRLSVDSRSTGCLQQVRVRVDLVQIQRSSGRGLAKSKAAALWERGR